MKAPPRVAVSQRVDRIENRDETRDALDQRLVRWLGALGCLSFAVPNTLDDDGLKAWFESLRPDAVVLSGGNDPGQFPARDATENALLDYAEALALPVLGICRGMQMLGLRAGADLHPVSGHAGTRHDIDGEIAGNVNSYHHLALRDCPAGYRLLARGADGVVEAIRHRQLRWEGWMWHPEREADFDAAHLARAAALLCPGESA